MFWSPSLFDRARKRMLFYMHTVLETRGSRNKAFLFENSPLLSLSTLSNLPSTLLRKESKSNGDERPWSTLRLFPLQKTQYIHSIIMNEAVYDVVNYCRLHRRRQVTVSAYRKNEKN